MLAFVLKYWKWIALAVAVLVLWGVVTVAKRTYDEGKREEGRAEIQIRWDEDKARRIKATTDQVLLWDKERQKHEKAIRERDEQHELRIKEARALVAKLPLSVARTAVPASVVELLNRAASNTGPVATSTRSTSKAVRPTTTASNDKERRK